MYDKQYQPEQQYERCESPVMAYLVLTTLVAVVCFIAASAAWTSA